MCVYVCMCVFKYILATHRMNGFIIHMMSSLAT